MNYTCIEANKRLQLEMSGMQQASGNAVKEWIAYTEKVENQFQEDTCSTAKTKATTEQNLWHWYISKTIIWQFTANFSNAIIQNFTPAR